MAFTYTDDPAGVARDALRLEVGDTEEVNRSLSDGECDYFLARHGITDPTAGYSGKERALLHAAVEACEALAGKYAKEASYSSGGMSEQANKKDVSYRRRAAALRQRLNRTALPFVGGRSKDDKDTAADDSDAVQPAFARGQFDHEGTP